MKKFLTLLTALCAMLSTCILLGSCGGDSASGGESDVHTHTLTFTEAKAPDCESDGSLGYYTCEECLECFSDAEGECAADKSDFFLTALGHSLTKFDAVAPDCEAEGRTEYYACDRCDKYFSDEGGAREIEENGWILSPLGHSLTKFDAVAPNCTSEGSVEYYLCGCGKYFSDGEAKVELNPDAITLPPVAHTFDEEWSYDGEHHYKAANCGCDNERKDVGEHITDSETGFCTVCKRPMAETPGLVYREGDGFFAVCGYNGSSKEVSIPSEREGLPVAAIDSDAFKVEGDFYHGIGITVVSIPSSVKRIEARAFQFCEQLEKVIIANGVEYVGDEAFDGCDSLTEIRLPLSVKSVGANAFASKAVTVFCEADAENKISGHENWGLNAIVWDCNSNDVAQNGRIYAVIDGIRYAIPSSQTLAQPEAYVASQPESIKAAHIPSTVSYGGVTYRVTKILTYAFDHCVNLTEVTISEGVTSIYYGAFGDCPALESVVIPKSVVRMGVDGGIGGGYVFYFSNPELKIYLSRDNAPAYELEGSWNVYDPYHLPEDRVYFKTYLYSEQPPETEGSYWHFADGEIAEW